jgi:hypothetical protein
LLSLQDGELEVEQRIPLWSGAGWYYHRMTTADLDGDGRLELVLGMTHGFGIVAEDGAGNWERFFLQGPQVLGVYDLDGDGDDELVVRLKNPDLLTRFGLATTEEDDDVWILGLGDDRLPSWQEQRRPAAVPVPDTGDASVEEAWARSEVVGALGLLGEAAGQLERLTAITPHAPTQLALHTRAAKLWADGGFPQEAGQALVRAARLSDDPLPLLERARRHLHAAVDIAGELEVIATMGAHDAVTEELRASLEAREAQLRPLQQPQVTLAFDDALSPSWVVLAPGLVSRIPGQGLRVQPALDGELASVPLRRSSGPLRVDLDISVPRGEWGSQLELVLQPAGERDANREPLLQVRVDGSDQRNAVMVRGPRWYSMPATRREHGEAAWRGSLTFSYLPEVHRVALEVAGNGIEVERYWSNVAAEHAPPSGDVDLVLRTRRPQGLGGTYVIERISLSGPGVETRVTGTEDAGRALADGKPAAALERADGVTRWLALSDLGRADEGLDLLRAAVADEASQGRLIGLLRARPQQVAPALSAVMGPRWLLWFSEAWHDVTPSPHTLQTTSTWASLLGDLDDVRLVDFPEHADRLALARLARDRAAVQQAAHQPGLADDSLALARAWGERTVSDARTEVARTQARASLSETWLQMARTRVGRGDLAGARAPLTEALAVSPTPSMLAEGIDADDPLRALLPR